MIRIESLHARLSDRAILRGLDLIIGRGEVVALVGRSGAGKSVLLRNIVGLMTPDRGDILIDGSSVVKADQRELLRLRRKIGYVFQGSALLDSLTIRDNLRLALDDAKCRQSPVYETDRIGWAMETVNLPARVLEQRPDQLSGGMCRRAAVARAIIHSPEILLYDEPTTGLDPANAAGIDRLINRSRDVLGATSLLVTHDMRSVETVADRVAFLDDGVIRFLGAPAEFMASTEPDVQAFLRRRSGDVAPFSPPAIDREVF